MESLESQKLMKLLHAMLTMLPLCALSTGCAEMKASIGLDPDITIDYVTIHDPAERKAAIERDLKTATEAVSANPKSFDAHMELGKMLRESGDNKGAIASYSKAIEVDSGNVRGYRQRSMTYFSTKQFKEASIDLAEALKLKPNDPALLDEFAYSHMQMARKSQESSDFVETIKSLDAVISVLAMQLKINPQSAVLRSRLAAANLNAGDAATKLKDKKESQRRYLLAVEDFKKCIDGNFVGGGPPTGNLFFQAQARAGLSKAYLGLDRPQEALKAVTDMSESDIPKDALIQIYICQMRAYEKLSDEKKAAEIERKLESMRPKKENPGKYFPSEINADAQRLHKK